MAETIIRPTMKFIKIGYAAILLIVIALALAVLFLQWPPWIAWISPLLLVWPLKLHLQNRMTRMTLLDDKLRFDTGFMTKTTRTILTSRIQDITVSQRVAQRMFGVGDLSIETAGETSRLTITGIDRPQEVADRIHEVARTSPQTEM
jgi:membrane protein YdbS with pleckstrin-like domain